MRRYDVRAALAEDYTRARVRTWLVCELAGRRRIGRLFLWQKQGAAIVEKELDEEYWTMLGSFIEAFSQTESGLFLYIHHHSEISLEMARLITRSMKTSAMITFIRDLSRIKPLPSWSSDLDPVLKQMSEIDAIRNSVVHNVSFVTTDEERVSTNKLRRLPWKEERIYRVSPDLLFDLTRDAYKVDAHFISVIYGTPRPLKERKPHMPLLTEEWLYKPRANPLT
ncbi:MAG: hypothetical protein E6G39_00165 [Actinobacteria bacterium]|nr:MAG: hypothetical protein E6G39_00165 [Actinomycetota bacterium]